MYHSITVGDKNTWDDWKMIPSSQPVVAPPVEKVVSVDVPERDGTTYLSNSLTGYPVFKSREGTWEFYLDTDAKVSPRVAGQAHRGGRVFQSKPLCLVVRPASTLPQRCRQGTAACPASLHLNETGLFAGRHREFQCLPCLDAQVFAVWQRQVCLEPEVIPKPVLPDALI